MKTLLIAIAALVVVGVIGFMYRNALEHPVGPLQTASSTGNTGACTLEAKVCPDGSSVGRTGPNCTFAPCPAPNVELSKINVAFVLPSGYTANAAALGNDATLIAAYEKPASGDAKHAIVVRDYPIAAGKTANDVIIANTMFESSGMQATSMSQFKTKVIDGKTFYSVVLERFEGQVHSAYYLPRAHDVLRFEVLEKDVTNWTDASLNVETLPEHKALLKMLSTLQTS